MSSDLNIVLSFKAGKLGLEGKQLVADPRPGLLILHVEDEITHVAWRPRKEGQESTAPCKLEDDQVVFPQEAKLAQIGSTRNVALKFPEDASRNSFYWSQETDAGLDSTLISRFNSIVFDGILPQTQPSDMQVDVPAGQHIASSLPASSAVPSPSPPPPNLAAILEAALKAAAAPPTSAPSPSPSSLAFPGQSSSYAAPNRGGMSIEATNQLAASLLAQMGGGQGQGGNDPQTIGRKRAAAEALMKRMASDQGPSLQEVLKADIVVSLLNKIAAKEISAGEGGEGASPLMARLGEFLPDEHKGDERELRASFDSVAFKSQMASLSHALQTGQLDFKQFGLEGSGFSVVEFLEAFDQAAKKKRAAEGK